MKEGFSQDFLETIQGPSRFLGGEAGSVVKDWEAAAGRMILLFPDDYDLGMSHLGFKIIYHAVNEQADCGFEVRNIAKITNASQPDGRGKGVCISLQHQRWNIILQIFELGYTGILHELRVQYRNNYRNIFKRLHALLGSHGDLFNLQLNRGLLV